ncbi:hypothetical protein DAPPUDRAFT_308302 [Daphnia pulex]|uniref:palmitoyl-CoA hydrolase n=1 Tax=Daphnia pulex TaxID=6669 RepID=E9H789_DAPPU|nr:hypothetical protein DAPPUDRAFT_308302 [Daphnia pulex]|eukprot:EFX72411.1 hypothetical protein DAPPUDRAFT_308302 [Daphnia pulex]
MGFRCVTVVCLLYFFVTNVSSKIPKSTSVYKPVVIVHGIWDKKTSLDFMADRIRQAHPGTNVTVVDLLHGTSSLAPMWDQVEAFGAVARQISMENPEGIHLLCYSQGGLVCRGMIETFPDLNVATFVSLSSPQGGQYGDSFLRLIFHKAVKKTVHRIFYTSPGQRYSVANYWNDPHHQAGYIKSSKYLPYIDNIIPTARNNDYKINFLRLKKLILIGGPDDGVITPWQSSHFGFFTEDESVENMENRDVYTQDLFGLKSLQNKTKIYTIDGVYHHEWHQNVSVIDNCIIPHLD